MMILASNENNGELSGKPRGLSSVRVREKVR
jgi:hypothetical protein